MKAVVVTPAYSHVDRRLERVILECRLPWLTLYEHSDLPRVRSVLIEQALASDAERIILVDADTVPTVGVLRSLADGEGVSADCAVWGMYPLREGDRWSVNPEDPAEADLGICEGRSFRIVTGGLGLAAIHRESLSRLGASLPTVTEKEGLRWRPFCVPFVREEQGGPTYYADDGSLCVRLRESGTELWCDPRLRAGHVVRSVLTGLRG